MGTTRIRLALAAAGTAGVAVVTGIAAYSLATDSPAATTSAPPKAVHAPGGTGHHPPAVTRAAGPTHKAVVRPAANGEPKIIFVHQTTTKPAPKPASHPTPQPTPSSRPTQPPAAQICVAGHCVTTPPLPGG